MMIAILTKNLTKSYGNHLALNSVSLQVKKGELYGFLGRNGAGKSTFINTLTGIIKPTGGKVTLLGSGNSDSKLRRIGVLSDYTEFYNSMTALQHIRYFSSLQGLKLSKNDCLHVLKKVGIDRYANLKVDKYSFGMKKKLGIAQAIVNNPDLLILDEPTSGVDAESAINIQNLLLELNRKGTTIFMTSHNLGEVEKICTRLAIMKDGLIVNEGTLNELRKKYTESLDVSMEVSIKPNSELLERISRLTESLGSKGTRLNFGVPNNEIIHEVVRVLIQNGIGVHRISANQPNLEDIFLNG